MRLDACCDEQSDLARRARVVAAAKLLRMLPPPWPSQLTPYRDALGRSRTSSDESLQIGRFSVGRAHAEARAIVFGHPRASSKPSQRIPANAEVAVRVIARRDPR
jgi:hypothetical protein